MKCQVVIRDRTNLSDVSVQIVRTPTDHLREFRSMLIYCNKSISMVLYVARFHKLNRSAKNVSRCNNFEHRTTFSSITDLSYVEYRDL
jgi:hypothetical protein